MSNEEEELTYWKAKYSFLEDEYSKLKKRNADLEERLLDMVEKIEGDKITLSAEIDDLSKKLELADKKIKYYENGSGSVVICKDSVRVRSFSSDSEYDHPLNNTDTPDNPAALDKNRNFEPIKLKATKSSDLKGYLHLPVLSLEEGFIYGFGWGKENKVKVV